MVDPKQSDAATPNAAGAIAGLAIGVILIAARRAYGWLKALSAQIAS